MKRIPRRISARYFHAFLFLLISVKFASQLIACERITNPWALPPIGLAAPVSISRFFDTESCSYTFSVIPEWDDHFGKCRIGISITDCVPSLVLLDCEIPSGDWVIGEIMVLEGATPIALYRVGVQSGSITIILIEEM
jgi:hypothetical protein